MRVSCKIIEDLMPIYVDGICSDETKQMVEEHLLDCESCSETFHRMANPMIEEVMEQEKDIKLDSRKIFKKVKQRWIVSLIIIILSIPLIYLGVNQIRGQGISYGSIRSVIKANLMLKSVKKGNYEKAFSYIDVRKFYDDSVYTESITQIRDDYYLVTIGENKYYVTDQILLNEYRTYQTDGDEDSFWASIYLGESYIMPEDTMDKLEEEADCTENRDPKLQQLVDSEYGKYYIRYGQYQFNSNDLIIEESRFVDIKIIPDWYYQILEEEEERQNEANAKLSKVYQDLGYEEYYQRSKDEFVQDMKDLNEQGVEITGYHLKEVERNYDRYDLNYQIVLHINGTMNKDFSLNIMEYGNRLFMNGGSYKNDFYEEAKKYGLVNVFHPYFIGLDEWVEE